MVMDEKKAEKILGLYRDYLLRCHNSVSDREPLSYEEKVMNRAKCLGFEEIVEAIDFYIEKDT